MTGPEKQPGGTVYGRGALDTREPRPGLFTRLHPAVTAAVATVIVALMAAGYGIWRSTRDTPVPVAAASAPASSAPVSASPSAAAPARLTAGKWVLSVRGKPKTKLTVDGEFAALTDGKGTVFDVVAGLADESCFSLRSNDKYLRHFDYRLRFDADDDSDLFRADATFCMVAGLAEGVVRLRSKNYLDHVIHRRGTELYIDEPDGSDKFVGESSFAISPPA